MTCSSSTGDPPNGEPSQITNSDNRLASQEEQAIDCEQVSTPSDGVFRRIPNLAPGLYLVSTPIGNLRDITLRALDVLASVDVICSEDTRVTQKLLNAYGIHARMRPYHDHTGAQARTGIVQSLMDGERVALVSDAGTPLVSDPGFKLVREAREAGANVYSIPGASALLAALASSGLPTDKFLFAGFPPPKSSARKRFLANLQGVDATLIFYEGQTRVAAMLADAVEVFGDRQAVVARELTKKFEEFRGGRLPDLAAAYAREAPPRGELVILVEPPEPEEATQADLDAVIANSDRERPVKELAAELALRLGLRKSDVYARILHLRATDDD